MRKWSKVLFMGMGEESDQLCKSLHARLEEGLHILNYHQQPPHSASEEEADRARDAFRVEEVELQDVARDIAMALTGRNISFI